MDIESMKSTKWRVPQYQSVHQWLRRKYGSAIRCENDPSHVSRRYEWANITGVYEKDAKHFIQLCKSCHVKLDMADTTRTIRRLQWNPQLIPPSKPVEQLDLTGTIIADHQSINEAARKLGISSGAITNVLKSRRKSAGGFYWKYKEKTI